MEPAANNKQPDFSFAKQNDSAGSGTTPISTDADDRAAFSMGLAPGEEMLSVDELTNLEIVKAGQNYMETLQLEKAVQLYDAGLKRFPNDTILLDAYTDLCLQMDQPLKARQLIERSI